MIAGQFANWQPQYAARGIALFPVSIGDGEKRPAIKGYLRIGRRGSAQLAQGQFANSEAFGFAVGQRSGITVLDVDTRDENTLADAMGRHGVSPFIVRSGSGNYQAWYRWNGESRSIRPDATKPIDILGGGFTVAPPSRGISCEYQIIQGQLDDLDRLPVLQAAGRPQVDLGDWSAMKAGAGRNNALFRQLMGDVRACDDLEQLLDCARTLNEGFGEPLPDDETVKIAQNVWRMTSEGRNRFGRGGAWLSAQDVNGLVGDPHLLALLNWLKANNGPKAAFMVADGLNKTFNWSRRQFVNARRRAVNDGWITQVSPAYARHAARYVWGERSKEDNGPLASAPDVGRARGPQFAHDGGTKDREGLVKDHVTCW